MSFDLSDLGGADTSYKVVDSNTTNTTTDCGNWNCDYPYSKRQEIGMTIYKAWCFITRPLWWLFLKVFDLL